MADEEKTQAAPAGNKTLIIVVIAGFVILIAVVLGVFFMSGALGGGKKQASAPGSQAGPVNHGGNAQALGHTIVFDTLIVNLNEPGGTRYLKVKFNLEVSNKSIEEELKKKMIPIRDSLIMYLSSLTLSETQSVEAKKKIKTNVKSRMNAELQSGRISRVFIEEFVIQ